MAAMAANTKNAVHIVRVLGSGCRKSMLMSGSFLGNPLRVNSPVAFGELLPSVGPQTPGGVGNRVAKDVPAHATAWANAYREPQRDRASMYGANTMARRPDDAPANGRW
jgi:hypothetical protein